jgi:hypothetical protein
MYPSSEPDYFYIEFHQNKIAIKTQKLKYLKSENQGWLVACEDKPGSTELFDF